MRAHRAGCGFTYLWVIFIVLVMTSTLALTGQVWHTEARREREKQLLWVGDEIRDAIGKYYTSSPGEAGGGQLPSSLEDLLKDSRYLTTRRYLRKIYTDPMTNSQEWGLIKSPAGGIVGVYSLSEEKPLKTGNFTEENRLLADGKKYSDWKFFYERASEVSELQSEGLLPSYQLLPPPPP